MLGVTLEHEPCRVGYMIGLWWAADGNILVVVIIGHTRGLLLANGW